jgi:NADH:ubiquinone oxidoreductase subunit 6 (subunit J)
MLRDFFNNLNEFLYNAIVFLFVNNWPLTLVVTIGTAALYVLLPRPRRFSWLLGVVLAVGFVFLAAWFYLPNNILTIENFLFYAFSILAIGGGLLLVTQSNPVRAALSFAVVVLATCGLFLLQAAPFLMAATIIVYAGAIIVTFLFVIMLAQQEGLSDADQRSREPFLSACAGFALLAVLLFVLNQAYRPNEMWELRQALQEHFQKTEELLGEVRDRRQDIDSGKGAELKESIDRTIDRVNDHRNRFENWLKTEWNREWRVDARLLTGALENLDAAVGDARVHLDGLSSAFEQLQVSLEQLRSDIFIVVHSGGGLLPSAEKLSELSGPRSSHYLTELRRDDQGRPVLPAENTAYLGKSLFSDYLLAVELAGVLLLVAAIGAIAIAYRRREERTT